MELTSGKHLKEMLHSTPIIAPWAKALGILKDGSRTIILQSVRLTQQNDPLEAIDHSLIPLSSHR